MEYFIIFLLFSTTVLGILDALDARQELRNVRAKHDKLMGELVAVENRLAIELMRKESYEWECQ